MTTPKEETAEDIYSPPSLSALGGRRAKQTTRPVEAPAGSLQAVSAQPGVGQPIGSPAGQPIVSPRPTTPVEAPSADFETDPDTGPSAKIPVQIGVSAGVRKRIDSSQARSLGSGKRKKPHLDIIFEALDAADQAGWDVVVSESLPQVETRRFSRTRPKDRDYAGTGPNPIYVRMTKEEVAEVEKAATEAGVPDRTKLIAICLNWYLPGTKDMPTGRA